MHSVRPSLLGAAILTALVCPGEPSPRPPIRTAPSARLDRPSPLRSSTPAVGLGAAAWLRSVPFRSARRPCLVSVRSSRSSSLPADSRGIAGGAFCRRLPAGRGVDGAPDWAPPAGRSGCCAAAPHRLGPDLNPNPTPAQAPAPTPTPTTAQPTAPTPTLIIAPATDPVTVAFRPQSRPDHGPGAGPGR